MRCKNCNRVVRQLDGVWFHTWWIEDPEDRMRKVMAGNSECNWKGSARWPADHAVPDSGAIQES